MRRNHLTLISSMVAGLSLVSLSACSASSSPRSTAADAAIGAVDLAAAGCPSTVVIQADWEPGAEHGPFYQLFGPDPEIDSSNKSVRGPLYADGAPTGVDLEIRSGGAAVGFQSGSSLLYTDPMITFAFAGTDFSIATAEDQPVTAVFAPFEKSGGIIMWDPETYPDAKTIKDVADAGAIIRYSDGNPSMAYLIAQGLVDPANVDPAFDGTPANFIAAAGHDAQQGVASTNVYQYEVEIPEWGKPVAYQYLSDVGYDPYQSSIVARTADVETLSDCFSLLIPAMQQAELDYFRDPSTANALIVKAVEENASGWTYSEGMAAFASTIMLDEGMASNGTNDHLGDFDDDRVEEIIRITTPIFSEQGITVSPDLSPDSLVTNRFIDTSIGF
jgi:hypothetical protein